jgi:DNA-directed RNA polymerase specialized sigma24 family protein
MSRPRHIDWKLVSKAQAMVAETTDIRQLKAAQAVLLPAITGTTLERTASLLGVGRASVHRLQQQFRQSLQALRGPARSGVGGDGRC